MATLSEIQRFQSRQNSEFYNRSHVKFIRNEDMKLTTKALRQYM